jgi:amidase
MPTSPQELPADIWRWSASDIAAQVRQRQVSCIEVCSAFLERAAAVNGRLNAIVHLEPGKVLALARAADEALAGGCLLGPLHGVPVSIKLNVDVQGEATSNGVPAFAARVAPGDSSVVANLRCAGAVLFGRTNTPPFSFRWFTENPLHGRTLNPWDPQATSGGSSGGAGVSVAAGMVPLAHGTDIAGSIRYPAYVNGLVGLRATPGRIPAFHPTVEKRYYGLQSMSAQGALARSVKDVRLALLAMARGDARDPNWVDAPLAHACDGARLRVALVERIPDGRPCDEVGAALGQAARALENAGYTVEAAQPPDLREAVAVWQSIVMTEAKLGMVAAVDAIGDRTIARSVHLMADAGPQVDLAGYIEAIATRDRLRRQWNAFFARYPLVLMPTSCRLPMPWGEDTRGLDEMRQLIADQSPLVATAALGLPGLNVPTGLARGLPVGVQLVAEPFRELRMLAAAEVIEANVRLPLPPAAG